MSLADRNKWNTRYREQSPQREPSCILTQFACELPSKGRVLDVAGGAGRHAVWLAQQGLDVTLCDVSSEALLLAHTLAAERGVAIQTLEHDLEALGLPPGPWDGIVSFQYLQRSLFPQFATELSKEGWLFVCQPTVVNLQRHSRPPREFLLETGELRKLVADLDILQYAEDWLDDGRHEAFVLAQR